MPLQPREFCNWLYLVGNPLITFEITDIRAGTLVPFRVELYAVAERRSSPTIGRHPRDAAAV
jgi:hypothetical protein